MFMWPTGPLVLVGWPLLYLELEGLGSILTQASTYSGKGSYWKEIQRIEVNASQVSQ